MLRYEKYTKYVCVIYLYNTYPAHWFSFFKKLEFILKKIDLEKILEITMNKSAAWRSSWADFYPQKSSSKTFILYAASMLLHLQSKISTLLSSVYAVYAFIYAR